MQFTLAELWDKMGLFAAALASRRRRAAK